MKIVWSERAIVHLTALSDYIGQESSAGAGHVAKKILDTVGGLSEHPEIGRPGRIVGTRELVVPGTPYVIPYRVRRGRVELIAVFHGRQRWPRNL